MEKWNKFFESGHPKHFQVKGTEIREARFYVSEKILNDTQDELFEDPEEFFKIMIACTPLEKNDKDPEILKQAIIYSLSRWTLKKFIEVIEKPEDFKNLDRTIEFMRMSINRENVIAANLSTN